MEEWIKGLVEQFGYWGVFFLIAIENVFPPIPSEVILTFSGFLTYSTNLTVFGVVLVSTAGSVIGAVILYGIGLLLDVERLEKIIDKYGKVLRLTREDIYKADAWFDKYGIWTVLFCRVIPLVRSLISIPAGMSNSFRISSDQRTFATSNASVADASEYSEETSPVRRNFR